MDAGIELIFISVLQAVIEMAKQIEMHTVVEGIENQDCEDILVELSDDYGQGYFYNKPILVGEFEKKYSKSAGKER